DLAIRLRALVHERADPARLRPREVLSHDASRREEDRILRVGLLDRGTPLDRLEVGLAVRVAEATSFVETRRAVMVQRRARPEAPHPLVDLLPGDPEVVGHAAARRDAELVEDLARRAERELLLRAEARGEVADDLPVLPGPRRRLDRLPVVDHA